MAMAPNRPAINAFMTVLVNAFKPPYFILCVTPTSRQSSDDTLLPEQ